MNNNCFQGLLSNCTAKNNEEYKAELQKRMRAMLVLLLLGIVILSIVGVLMLLQPEFVQNSYYAGWFMGLSTGLILGSILIILKLRRTMNNELLLKEARLSETDEREKEISDRALKLTLKTLLLTLYLLLFFCTFVSVEALTVLYLLIAEFFICHLLYRKYYSTKL